MRKLYINIEKVQGPLIVVSQVENVSYDEMVGIIVNEKDHRRGKVVQLFNDKAIIQVFEQTADISINNTKVDFLGRPLAISVSKEILGRKFNGLGEPIDNRDPIYSDKQYNVNGTAMNPIARKYPRNFIQTGISSIDGLLTLIRGQKLPIFTGNGLPHNKIAAQIVNQAQLSGISNKDESFAVVFVAMGIKHDDADFFFNTFEEAGVMDKVVMFVNYADDSIAERIVTPRCALTCAEYLAFEEGMHVLVVMTDMTSYCEALRELSSSREEVPSRKGYPGYLYSDLASIYERAGMLRERQGSITQIPILSMPNDDITHPIPDLTGFITEGQIIVDRGLHLKGVYPPINILPSLSRLAKDGIGEGFTREDHAEVSNQLFSSYAKVQDVQALAQVIGEDELSDVDKKYLEFGKAFEESFINQGFSENRNIFKTLDLAWEMLGILPVKELDRVRSETLEKYYKEVK
ncbi:MAG: V-type ATP synthase subunit B [Oscillospiraceae bacterium]|nr:V-type ATP synthase subunit B [Oscillospiraceae bacterium]